MLKMLLFPFRLLYYVVLTLVRIAGFLCGASLRTARYMAGSSIVLGIGALLGLLVGRKLDGWGHPSRMKRDDPSPKS
jgi:hypothetical protein